MSDQHRLFTEQGQQLRVGRGEVGGHQQHDRVRAVQARRQRLAHRADRKHAAVSERPFAVSGLAVDHDQGQGLSQRRVLVAVVHDHDLGARRGGGPGAGDAVAGDPEWRILGQHQRLVADVAGGMAVRIHPQRPGEASPVATRQAVRGQAPGREPMQQLADDRRLACAAQGQVADADHRRAGIGRCGAGDPPSRDAGPDPGRRRQQDSRDRWRAAGAGVPPARGGEPHRSRLITSDGTARASESLAST